MKRQEFVLKLANDLLVSRCHLPILKKEPSLESSIMDFADKMEKEYRSRYQENLFDN